MIDRKEYRFTRNPEKTEEVINSLFESFNMDRTNPRMTHVAQVLEQHFILDDTKTGKSIHLLHGYFNPDGSEGPLALASPDMENRLSFREVKTFMQELADDRQSPIQFYYQAETYEVKPREE